MIPHHADSFAWHSGSHARQDTTRFPVLCSFLLVVAFSLSACAQQADLVRVQRDFETKIAKLDQEKKVLEQTLAEANQSISESKKILAKQKSELTGLIRARAQINSELRSLREENLTQLSGELETESHRLDRLNQKLDDATQEVTALEQLLNERDRARATQITALGKDMETGLAQQNKAMSDQMAEFRNSLVEFKEALATVDTRLTQEQDRASTAETALQTKLDSDTQALKSYVEKDVKTSVDSIAVTLKEVNANLSSQLDSQGSQITEQAARVSDINTTVGTEIASLKQQDSGIQQDVENMTKSLTQLRNVLDTSGTQVGAKIDEHGQTLQQTTQRLAQLEKQYAGLSQKLDADTKSIQGYLDKDVRTSLESMAKAIDAEKIQTSQGIARVEGLVQTVDQKTTAGATQVQAQIKAQETHLQELTQSVVGLREVLDAMALTLGKRSDDQIQKVGQLIARLNQIEEEQTAKATETGVNTQAISAHLNEVTASVQSVIQSLEQVKSSLSSRLDEQSSRLENQERRLTETGSSVASVQTVKQELQSNVQHLNDVTNSLSQLKGVVNDIGAKLGAKVDEHDARLGKLTQQLQQLQQSGTP